MRFDSAEQERATIEVAAITDRELVAGIRATFGALALRTWAWWRELDRSTVQPIHRKAHTAVEQARQALGELADDDLDAAVRAVEPVLGMYWPDPGGTSAVEQLRRRAMQLPQMRAVAREIRQRDRPIPWQEPAGAVTPPTAPSTATPEPADSPAPQRPPAAHDPGYPPR